MPNEVEYRGFTISPDYKSIYLGEHILGNMIPWTTNQSLEQCKSVIDSLIDKMQARGFTCPPKPTKVRKVQWLSLPANCEKWDKEDAERMVLKYEDTIGHRNDAVVSIGDDYIILFYRVVEE